MIVSPSLTDTTEPVQASAEKGKKVRTNQRRGKKGMRFMRSLISSNIFVRNEEGEDKEDRLDAKGGRDA